MKTMSACPPGRPCLGRGSFLNFVLVLRTSASAVVPIRRDEGRTNQYEIFVSKLKLTTYIIADFLRLVHSNLNGYNQYMKQIMSVLKWLVLLLLVAAVASGIWVSIKLKAPATSHSSPKDFEIRKGDTAGEIVNRLKDKKLVRNELLMEIYLRWKDAENKLQAGVYTLDSNMTIPEVVQILSQGKVKASGIKLTIVEGSTIDDIASRLADLQITDGKEFKSLAQRWEVVPNFDKPMRNSLEGFLFPDTYLIKAGTAPEQIIDKMLENFGRRVPPDLSYDQLILASIVEREVGRNYKTGTKLPSSELEKLSEERRIVAGVFMNRLNARMGLESDATLQYITGSKSPRATIEETKLDSPYNTYKYRGLPPTPISNPSLDSIVAAINPSDTDYLFFLTSPDGTAHFAKTLDEHKKNRALYLE